MRSAATASRTSTKKAIKAALRHTMAPTNSSAITMPSSECEEGVGEQRDHDQCHQQRGDRAQRDRDVDVVRAPRQHLQVGVHLGRCARVPGELRLEGAGAVDDARQAIGQHAEGRRHPRQQEHRGDRGLDQMRDIHGGAGAFPERGLRRRASCTIVRQGADAAVAAGRALLYARSTRLAWTRVLSHESQFPAPRRRRRAGRPGGAQPAGVDLPRLTSSSSASGRRFSATAGRWCAT